MKSEHKRSQNEMLCELSGVRCKQLGGNETRGVDYVGPKLLENCGSNESKREVISVRCSRRVVRDLKNAWVESYFESSRTYG